MVWIWIRISAKTFIETRILRRRDLIIQMLLNYFASINRPFQLRSRENIKLDIPWFQMLPQLLCLLFTKMRQRTVIYSSVGLAVTNNNNIVRVIETLRKWRRRSVYCDTIVQTNFTRSENCVIKVSHPYQSSFQSSQSIDIQIKKYIDKWNQTFHISQTRLIRDWMRLNATEAFIEKRNLAISWNQNLEWINERMRWSHDHLHMSTLKLQIWTV